MTFRVVEDWEETTETTVTRVKIYENRDERGVIRRYDNENETPGRHECHTPDGVTEIEFPGMLELRDRFVTEIESTDGETDDSE